MEQEVKDLFAEGTEPQPPVDEEHKAPPSESVFIDMGADELFYVGEVQLPRPTPVELVVEIDGWDYVYKLDRRAKSA